MKPLYGSKASYVKRAVREANRLERQGWLLARRRAGDPEGGQDRRRLLTARQSARRTGRITAEG